MVDSHIFMEPEMDQVLNRTDIFGICGTNTLDYFPDVSQVEGVMGLGRSRQKLSFDELEYFETVLTDWPGHISCRFRELFEVEIQQRGEN